MSTINSTIDPNEEKGGWKYKDLVSILDTAIKVELFTIPVYLSAATSIQKDKRYDKIVPMVVHENADGSGDGTKTEMFAPFNVIMSVAVQEMYHFTVACNLANAMGIRPNITAPDLDNPPSCIPLGDNPKTRGNLTALLPTMLAIEKPDPKYSYDEDPEAPLSPNGPKTYQENYGSIGDMYHALAYGVQAWWSTLYNTENDKYGRTNFSSKYQNVTQVITTLEEAYNAIASIVEQGEGNGTHSFMPDAYVPTIPTAQFHDLDEVSHWGRFLAIQDFGADKIAQYTGTSGDVEKQKDLTNDYSRLIQQMADNFKQPGSNVNLRGMAETGTLATSVWEAGQIPHWKFETTSPWPIPSELHVCQGLNMCAGHGFENSGSMPGNGECATVYHACQYTNDCRGQGACGYPGKDLASGGDDYSPGQNSCSAMGGCQSPISPCQMYPEADDNLYSNQYIWKVARQLFEDRCNKLGIVYGEPSAKINAQRYLSQPTNPDPAHKNTPCKADESA
jgi:hypothetical protein